MILRASLVALLLSVTPAAAYDCSPQTYRLAKIKIEGLFDLGYLQSAGRGRVAILMNDAFWRRLTFPQKQQFADELVCAVAGVGKALGSIEILSLSTGNPIGEWSMGTLKVK